MLLGLVCSSGSGHKVEVGCTSEAMVTVNMASHEGDKPFRSSVTWLQIKLERSDKGQCTWSTRRLMPSYQMKIVCSGAGL